MRRGDVEVDPAADDAGRDHPDRNVPDQVRVPAEGSPPAAGDVDRRGDGDHVHQAVEVDVQRPEVESVGRRARDEAQRHAAGVRWHTSRVAEGMASEGPMTVRGPRRCRGPRITESDATVVLRRTGRLAGWP